MRRRHSQNRSGFTLIEIMMVVAIIGILASVAIPEFVHMSLKAKQAERSNMVPKIVQSVITNVSSTNRFPTSMGGAFTSLNLVPNPPAPPSSIKQNFDANLPDWNYVTGHPEGQVYYQYTGWGIEMGTIGLFELWVYGDLDADGVQSQWQIMYWHANGVTVGWEPFTDDYPTWETSLGVW